MGGGTHCIDRERFPSLVRRPPSSAAGRSRWRNTAETRAADSNVVTVAVLSAIARKPQKPGRQAD
jgi:hypothetical protein